MTVRETWDQDFEQVNDSTVSGRSQACHCAQLNISTWDVRCGSC